jgi:hypothetical protein
MGVKCQQEILHTAKCVALSVGFAEVLAEMIVATLEKNASEQYT